MATVIALLLFVGGAWIAGLLLVMVAAALAALLVAAVRREPQSPGALLLARTYDRAASRARLATVSVRAWVHAGERLAGIHRRRRLLHHELEDRLKPFGANIYRDGGTLNRVIHARASDLDQALEEIDHEAAAEVRAARRRIERERFTSQPTEVLSGDKRS